MRKYVSIVVLLSFCLWQWSAAYSSVSHDAIEKALAKTGIEKNNIGVVLYDIKDKKLIYSLNGNRLFSIASVNKLFVTAVALKYLGQDYRFKTTVYGDVPDKNGVIKRDIYIKGGGDPLFVSESMWFLVNRLTNIGVKSIRGNIILDNTSFPPADVYEEGGDDRAYSAKLSALSVNFNSVAVSMTAGPSPYVTIDPQISSLKLVDKTKSTIKKTNTKIKRNDNKIIVTGNLNSSEYSNKILYRNIDDPDSYFAEVLKLHLKYRGINLTGSISKGIADTNKIKLFEVESRRLNDILVEMNKFSNNFIAEQLVRAIADKKFGKASETDKVIELINSYLRDIGLEKSGFEIVNGSGFSRMNKIKPEQMVKFLDSVYNDFQITSEFVNSLSIAGIDGTVRKTHKSDFMTGKLRAKTGTLSGIRSLAGYLSNKGKVYAFMIVANDPNAYSLMNWEGNILQSLMDE